MIGDLLNDNEFLELIGSTTKCNLRKFEQKLDL